MPEAVSRASLSTIIPLTASAYNRKAVFLWGEIINPPNGHNMTISPHDS